MFQNLGHFFKKIVKEPQKELGSKDAAKERLHLVLMQDRANVSADFLELMKQEIIDVIKKYIVVDEDSIDVRLTNQTNEDGTNGAPSLYANIPIVNIKNDMMAEKIKEFEGVDFNKEMGIPPYNDFSNNTTTDVENKEEIPQVIELPENSKTEENLPQNNEANTKEEKEEVEEMFEEVDDAEEDDDVTFDDLLKAAEAAEKMVEEPKDTLNNNEQNNKLDNNNVQGNNNTSQLKSNKEYNQKDNLKKNFDDKHKKNK